MDMSDDEPLDSLQDTIFTQHTSTNITNHILHTVYAKAQIGGSLTTHKTWDSDT